MTNEQKAKAYDEALKDMRVIYPNLRGDAKLAVEHAFPELAESEDEDERIRKRLINFLRSSFIKENLTDEKVAPWIAYLEKRKDLDKMIVVSPEVWDKAISDAFENGKKDGEKQKEQKPVESISQLTVQGKGVYKICPRCKERMVRDDSMVYTSMPPQYRYECPKCGEMEFDTVMYDNPEMGKQKPVEKHDLVAQLKEHLANTPKEQLEAEWKELKHWNNIGPTVEEYFHRIKPAEWSVEDEKMLQLIIKDFRDGNVSSIGQEQWLKSLPERFNLQSKQEWSKEDEMCLSQAIETLEHENYLILADKLKSLRPSWKPSEEQMEAVQYVSQFDYGGHKATLVSLYEQLKKL